MDRVAVLRGILQENPTDTFARYGLAMALEAGGKTDEALEEYGAILSATPDYVPAYQMSGQLLLRLGRLDDARERLQAGLAAAERTKNAHAASEMEGLLVDIV